MKAEEIIVNIIKDRIFCMNTFKNELSTTRMKEFEFEVHGMFICLRNIHSSNKFYYLCKYDDGYEFGYYKEDEWFVIEK